MQLSSTEEAEKRIAEQNEIAGRQQHTEEEDGITTGRRLPFFGEKQYTTLPADKIVGDGVGKGDSIPLEVIGESDVAGCRHTFKGFYAYLRLLRRYPFYRLYLFSHLCQHAGDWFVRIASLLVVQRLAPDSGSSIAALVIANMIPKALLSQVGGGLADSFDRRKMMVGLDIAAGLVTLGFLVAVAKESLFLIYAVSFVRSAIGAIYYPSTTGMVPLIVPDTDDLKFAVTMNSWAWSIMAIIGGILAGNAVEYIGLSACFVVDTVSFFASAAFMMQVTGNYNVATQEVRRERRNSLTGSCLYSANTFVVYLMTCKFAFLTVMKASGALLWGPEDILGVAYATVDGNEDETSSRMGILFSFIGLGCLVGPTVANYYTDISKPKTLQASCLVGMAINVLGWLSISTVHNFWFFVIMSCFRSSGSAIIWVNSTLLLQTLSAKGMLGRILAIEYAFYTIFEALSATSAGRLQDIGLNKDQIALAAAGASSVVLGLWCTFHWLGKGAALPEFADERFVAFGKDESSELPTAIVDQFDDEIELADISDGRKAQGRRLSRRSITSSQLNVRRGSSPNISTGS
jgi:MFS family permease